MPEKTKSPGPGSYKFKELIGTEGISRAITPRRPEALKRTLSPGPGQYDSITDSVEKKHPTCAIGNEVRGRDRSSSVTPGPNVYSPRSDVMTRAVASPRAVFGNSTRRPLSSRGKTPGPGNYNPANEDKQGPTYHIVGKGHLKKSQNVPGPGTYTPSQQRKRAPTCAIGNS